VGGTSGVSCAFKVADADGSGVEVYAPYERHDVENRRLAPLTR
jgi:hypothetical protein